MFGFLGGALVGLLIALQLTLIDKRVRSLNQLAKRFEAQALLRFSDGLGIEVFHYFFGPHAVFRQIQDTAPKPNVVVGRPGVKLSKRHARRHAQQVSDGGLAISGGGDFRPIVSRFVVQ